MSRADAVLTVESLETGGLYRSSEVRPPHWNDPLTLLALRIDGDAARARPRLPRTADRAEPAGVLQTKWVSKVVAG